LVVSKKTLFLLYKNILFFILHSLLSPLFKTINDYP
jgi:hypothetical protein